MLFEFIKSETLRNVYIKGRIKEVKKLSFFLRHPLPIVAKYTHPLRSQKQCYQKKGWGPWKEETQELKM